MPLHLQLLTHASLIPTKDGNDDRAASNVTTNANKQLEHQLSPHNSCVAKRNQSHSKGAKQKNSKKQHDNADDDSAPLEDSTLGTYETDSFLSKDNACKDDGDESYYLEANEDNSGTSTTEDTHDEDFDEDSGIDTNIDKEEILSTQESTNGRGSSYGEFIRQSKRLKMKKTTRGKKHAEEEYEQMDDDFGSDGYETDDPYGERDSDDEQKEEKLAKGQKTIRDCDDYAVEPTKQI